MKYLVSALILLSLSVITGCGGGGGGTSGTFHAARCNNGELSKKNSCTEACQDQGGVREWLVHGCGPVP